jgi:hypothetical protein
MTDDEIMRQLSQAVHDDDCRVVIQKQALTWPTTNRASGKSLRQGQQT